MKFAVLLAGIALASTPAMASEVVHQTSVVHKGQTVAVTYEPKVEYTLRQTGIGPKVNPACLWTARVSVQRTATGADGQPIAALTRVVEGAKTRSGQVYGHCSMLTDAEKAGFAGNRDALRSHVVAVAGQDAPGLHAELTSLAVLGSAIARAR